MNSFSDWLTRSAPGVSCHLRRRDFLAGGLLAACAGGQLRAALPDALASTRKCIVLWMAGGPSHSIPLIRSPELRWVVSSDR